MFRAILKKAAAIDLLADGALPLTTRFKLGLFRNRSRTQGRRNRLQMASVRALRDLEIDIHGDGNDLCINGELRTPDSHPIFDGRGAHINPSADISNGDHVWVGSRCVLLKRGNLGHGSVLASACVLTRHIGERVIAAGIPAKVSREDIEWRR